MRQLAVPSLIGRAEAHITCPRSEPLLIIKRSRDPPQDLTTKSAEALVTSPNLNKWRENEQRETCQNKVNRSCSLEWFADGTPGQLIRVSNVEHENHVAPRRTLARIARPLEENVCSSQYLRALHARKSGNNENALQVRVGLA